MKSPPSATAAKASLAPVNAVSQLCPSCGLCCNGVLFADVQLQSGDKPEVLAEIGLELEERGRKRFFKQPCSCFDGQWCRAYSLRPKRCRTFECGTLQRVQGGEITAAAALVLIRRARRQTEAVRRMLSSLGEGNEQLALTERYRRVIAQPVDLRDTRQVAQRAQLMRLMDRLMQLLHRDFLK